VLLYLESEFRDHARQTSSIPLTSVRRFNKKLLHIQRIPTLYCECPRYSVFVGANNFSHMKNTASEIGGSPGTLF